MHTSFCATEQLGISCLFTKYHPSFKLKQYFSTFADHVFSESGVMAAWLDKPFQDPDQYTHNWKSHFHVRSLQVS